jgi:hypothetical protein
MELPLLQMRRFLAAVAILPAPPELPGRRWEKPARWLESLRLKRFEAALVKLGVERVVDFGELMTMDLVAVGMSPLQRRRFQAAVETDAQPTLEGEVLLPTRAVTEADQRVAAERSAVVVGSTGAMRSEDVLRLTPARWLSLIRCESFTEKFEELGVETSVDFAEVTEDDLQTMGVPLLHKRRFTQAAVQVREDQHRTTTVSGAFSGCGVHGEVCKRRAEKRVARMADGFQLRRHDSLWAFPNASSAA